MKDGNVVHRKTISLSLNLEVETKEP